MNAPWRLLLLILIVQFFPANLQAADLIMPQGRRAYYSEEPIELAVAGLAKDKGTLELIPKGKAFPVILDIQGNGSTVTLVLPKWTLAPGEYTVKLNGKNAGNLTISSGVVDSTLLLSQTINHQQLKEAGANFIVSNAFNYGNFSPDHTGPRIKNLRQSKSRGLLLFEQAIAMNLLSVVYMYWTGYVTHKPFGSKKSWADKKMTQAMRLLSFHTAQRLRRFRKNIVSVGTIDEPGLGWGKTPAGHTASGFPDWDEKDWYQARGWKYTNDPASRSAQDWMKYMTIRCGIIKEQQAQARKDLTTVWPEMVFSTDLYAPHAIMDGTDPLSQVVNDIPASHVFADWGSDRLGVYSGIKLENAHDPTARLAHAMNGQLFAKRVPQPNQLHAYRVCLNGMLAAGIKSNWWLNTGGMSPKELAAVNNPAKRIGPMLQEADLNDHYTAVLWSFTEIAMREKSLTAKEAHKKPGEKILVTVKDLPEHGPIKSRELSINAYSIGSDYRDGVMLAHYALSRAGYPAHIVHERILPKGILKNYKTLVIIGQTFALPPEIRKEIRQFQAAGGKIVVDKSTTVSFKDAIVAPFDFSGLSYRWNALFTLEENKFKSKRHDSYYQCNHFMDEPVRQAVAPLKKTMAKTNSQPRLETDSTELVVERHKAEEGSIYMVINGYEELPKIPENKEYWVYNFATYSTSFKLQGLPEKCTVYSFEGADWSKAGQLNNPHQAIKTTFAAGEMKLFLVAPRPPKGLKVSAQKEGGTISVRADLLGLKMPWPLMVTVRNPQGEELYKVYRATPANGTYQEVFPLGTNAAEGSYTVEVKSPLANLGEKSKVNHSKGNATPKVLSEDVRAFDADTIKSFLAKKPAVTIAIGDDAHKGIAQKLATALSARGLTVSVKPDSEVLTKVHYPRVWNPYAKVYSPTGSEKPLAGKKIENRIHLATDKSGKVTAKTVDGKELNNWRLPHSVVTIGGEGFVNWSGDDEFCYLPGVKLYVEKNRRPTVIKGTAEEKKTSKEFREKWAKPWMKLRTHVGGYQLPPQLPEAYTTKEHLILLGDSTSSHAVAIVQASDLLLQVVDKQYPGPGKALISFIWSPFEVEKNVILVGASDQEGITKGIDHLLKLAP